MSARPEFANIGYGGEAYAPYATVAVETRGRLVNEPESPTRTPFQRDRDRIIHSTAFRRLRHKTQVFIFEDDDHFRTRLTHTIEVAQIARAIARALRLNEDLAEAVALAHDMGHTPFGHAGENVLMETMRPFGGFEHNAQTLRVVTALERRYAHFDGLNLSWETLEGIVKHNGPLTAGDNTPIGHYAHGGLPETLSAYNEGHDLELSTFAGLEAQGAAIADDIAYVAHDIDDGLRAGMFQIDELKELPLVGDLLVEVRSTYPGLEPSRQAHELVRRIITRFIEDVISGSASRLALTSFRNAAAAREHNEVIVRLSREMDDARKAIKAFLFERLYLTDSVMKVRDRVEAVVHDLFYHYLKTPEAMHTYYDELQLAEANLSEKDLARHVCDFVAGMTDRFAMKEHERLI